MGLVYKATSPSGKVYIGKTSKTLKERIASHKKDLSRKEYKNSKFYNAIRKYGFDSIIWEVVEDDVLDENINNLEIELIKKFDSYKNGLNSTTGGDGGYTLSHFSEKDLLEWKKKISKATSGANNPMFGKKGRITGEKNPMKNPDTVRKVVSSLRGRKCPEETRRKISESMRKAYKEKRR